MLSQEIREISFFVNNDHKQAEKTIARAVVNYQFYPIILANFWSMISFHTP